MYIYIYVYIYMYRYIYIRYIYMKYEIHFDMTCVRPVEPDESC